MTHKMHLCKEPFQKIWSGEKTIELRMFDEKRRGIKVGDIIAFSYIDNPKISMEVEVINLYRAANFKELFEMLPLRKCGYAEDNVPDAYLDMEKYPGYSVANQERFGVLGIEFKEIPYTKPFRDPFRMEPFLEGFQDALLKYWQEKPDLRFGQILSNFQRELERLDIQSFYCIEDESFLKLLIKYVRGNGRL